MTLRQLLQEGEQTLKNAGVEDAGTDAWYLLSYITGMTRGQYLLHSEEPAERVLAVVKKTALHRKDIQVTDAQSLSDSYRTLVSRRAQRIPLQHLTGTQEFMGQEFLVSPDVLIPRQDTENLVEEVLHWTKQHAQTSCKVLDLCTGSGCIAVSLALLNETAVVTGSDLSEEALTMASKNAANLGAEVQFVQGDLFENIRETYDIIVSNPPYIAAKVIETLMPEVRDHEPLCALDGGSDGLDFYRRIITEAPNHLCPGGRLFFEIGYDQGRAVQSLLQEAGFSQIECKKDLAGLDRIVSGTWNP